MMVGMADTQESIFENDSVVEGGGQNDESTEVH